MLEKIVPKQQHNHWRTKQRHVRTTKEFNTIYVWCSAQQPQLLILVCKFTTVF